MENRVCIKCEELKNIADFKMYNKNTGGTGIRNVCKACYNKRDRERKRSKTLSVDEIRLLKEIASNYKSVMSKISNQKQRIIKTFNIEKDVLNIIEEHSKKTGLSVSDIVNMLLKQGIIFLK